MSAIVGLCRMDGGLADPRDLAAAQGASAHRGPADESWTDSGAALGVRCRSTADEALFVAEGLCVVSDARIDNREELARSLGIPEAAEAGASRLIALAYRRWREECPEKLLGDFAFAVWDSRDRTLFCARDGMGIKPLYFFRSDRIFGFATELNALLALPGVPREVDSAAISRFVNLELVDRSATVFRGLHRLAAAHSAMVDGRGMRIRRYWDPAAVPELRFGSSEQYVEAFRELFVESVRARVPPDGTVGSTLSGGLDSSSIATVAARFTPAERLHTFSLVFPGLPAEELPGGDERRYMDAVLARTGGHPHFIRGDLISPLTDVRTVLERLGQPYDTPNLYLHWAMYREAGSSGATVLLDGLDGDVTVGHGLGRLNTYARAGDWAAFEALARGFAERRGMDVGRVLPQYGLPYIEHLARNRRFLRWGRGVRQLAARFGLSRRELLFRHGMRPALGGRDAKAANRDADFVDRRIQYEGVMQSRYQLMFETADVCAAAHGVEPRYPFFDRRLVEFCLAVPEEQKFDNGWTRLILRRAMKGILPPEVQWRVDKGNLSPNFHRGLRTRDAALLEAVDSARLPADVDTAGVAAARRRYLSGDDRNGQESDGLLLFRLAVLSSWLEGASGSGCPPRTTHAAADCAA